jgi:Tol biopolymer transport system component
MTDRSISEERISRALLVQADEALRPFDATEIARLATGSGTKVSHRWGLFLGRPTLPARWVALATVLLLAAVAALAAVVGASRLHEPAPLGTSPLFITAWICDEHYNGPSPLAECQVPVGVRASSIDPQSGLTIASWDLPFTSDTMTGPSDRPAWSPDRRRVLLYDWNNQLVAIVDVPTATVTTVAGADPTGITGYTWGPGSDRIARVSGGAADGVSIVDLTLHELARFDVPVLAMIDSPPAWSPDGSSIVVTGCLPCDRSEKGSPPEPSQRQLFLMPVDGSPVRAIPITSVAGVEGVPAWSPDGRSVALGSDGGIWMIDVADGRQRSVGPEPARDPRWSPDGRRLVFALPGDRLVGSRLPATEALNGIVVVDLEGGRATTLTHDRDATPQWSPDGSWIAFSRSTESNEDMWPVNVMIVPAAGGEPRLISTHAVVGW